MRLALKTNAMHDEEHGASAKQRNIQKLSSKKMKSIGPACTHPLKRNWKIDVFPTTEKLM